MDFSSIISNNRLWLFLNNYEVQGTGLKALLSSYPLNLTTGFASTCPLLNTYGTEEACPTSGGLRSQV